MVVRSSVSLFDWMLTAGPPLVDPPSVALQGASGGTLLSARGVRMNTDTLLGSIAVRVSHQPVNDSGAPSPMFMDRQRDIILYRQTSWICGRLDLRKVPWY